MLSWVVAVAGTFALSLVCASVLLRLRCRGVGPPFGPRARPWAVVIVTATAVVSTAFGLLIVAALRSPPAAYVGIVVPGGLWLADVAPRDRPRAAGLMRRPLERLYERMGDDMQAWCDIRRRAAAEKTQWIADAAKYYSDQVESRLKDPQALAGLARWRDSVMHKVSVVRLINLDTTPARLQATLQMHPSTRDLRRYAGEDTERLARRLESEALNELNLYLAYLYRLGHHKLLIYPFRPSAHRTPRPIPDGPGATSQAGGT